MNSFVLIIVLLICLYTDVKSRKILNIVTLPTCLLGFAYNIYTSGFEGFLFSGEGFIVGLALLFIPYLLGGMGAGDVKLLAAIGALMGSNFVFYSFIYIALIGGGIAAVLIIKERGFINLLKLLFFNILLLRSNLGFMRITKDKKSSISYPYGVAIFLGTLLNVSLGRI